MDEARFEQRKTTHKVDFRKLSSTSLPLKSHVTSNEVHNCRPHAGTEVLHRIDNFTPCYGGQANKKQEFVRPRTLLDTTASKTQQINSTGTFTGSYKNSVYCKGRANKP